MAFNAPHFDLPFRRSTKDNAVQCTEQDSGKDVLNCVNLVVRYPRGFRLEPEDFGVDELTFKSNPTAYGLLEQINEWEPRATLSLMDEVFDTAAHTLHSRIGVD